MVTPFRKILCGIEGSPASIEAARQAITLAGGVGGELQFTAVYTSFELGPDFHKETLEASLVEVADLAQEAGVSTSTQLREGRYAIDVLLPEAQEHDLLVLGTHGRSRASGFMFGSTATEAAHGTERPLLIAREAPGPDPFPKRILFASDGTSISFAPARVAAELAAALRLKLSVIHVQEGKREEGESMLDQQVAEITRICGEAPEVLTPDGGATKEIIDAAHDRSCSLIVAGRRGLRGIKALGSVSERIVGGAECSVLLIPGGEAA